MCSFRQSLCQNVLRRLRTTKGARLSVRRNYNQMAKLSGYDWWKSIGSPQRCVAPMVDGSELAFRLLTKEFGAQLTWTPMLHARLTAETETRYLANHFSTCPEDRPVIAQFAGDDPDIMLKAAKLVEHKVDAIDINLGCPQGIAKRGHYGSFLLDEPDLIVQIVEALHKGLSVPVTCKIRVLPSRDATLSLAKRLVAAGASLLTVHGRIRSNMKQGISGADWDIIRDIKREVNVPVVANGSIACAEDVHACMAYTGCDGVMVSEAILENPGLFTANVPTSGPLKAQFDDFLTSAGQSVTLPPGWTPSTHASNNADSLPRVNTLAVIKRYLQIAKEHPGGNHWGIMKTHVIKTTFGVFRGLPGAQQTLEAALHAGALVCDNDWRGAIDIMLAAVATIEEQYVRDVQPKLVRPGSTLPSGWYALDQYHAEIRTRQVKDTRAWEDARREHVTAGWARPEYQWDPVVPGAWYMRYRKDAYGGEGSKAGSRDAQLPTMPTVPVRTVSSTAATWSSPQGPCETATDAWDGAAAGTSASSTAEHGTTSAKPGRRKREDDSVAQEEEGASPTAHHPPAVRAHRADADCGPSISSAQVWQPNA